MKQKYGYEAQFPIERYVLGLSSPTVPDRSGEYGDPTRPHGPPPPPTHVRVSVHNVLCLFVSVGVCVCVCVV